MLKEGLIFYLLDVSMASLNAAVCVKYNCLQEDSLSESFTTLVKSSSFGVIIVSMDTAQRD